MLSLYYANWTVYRDCKPNKLPKCSRIIYAFFKPTNSGVEFSDRWADVEMPLEGGHNGCINQLLSLKHKQPNLRVVGSVGGWTYSSDLGRLILTQPSLLVKGICDLLIRQCGLDGVDIDWEYPQANEWPQFVKFLSELKLELNKLEHELGRELDISIAVPALPIAGTSLKDIDAFVSFYNVMAYDFAGPWSSHAGHHSSVRDAKRSIEQYSKQANKGKLVLGVPLYGRSFAKATGPGSAFRGTLNESESGVHPLHALPLPGYTEYFDERVGASFCVGTEGMVSYETKHTLKQKAILAKDLGGVMFWEASGDNGAVDFMAGLLN